MMVIALVFMLKMVTVVDPSKGEVSNSMQCMLGQLVVHAFLYLFFVYLFSFFTLTFYKRKSRNKASEWTHPKRRVAVVAGPQ